MRAVLFAFFSFFVAFACATACVPPPAASPGANPCDGFCNCQQNGATTVNGQTCPPAPVPQAGSDSSSSVSSTGVLPVSAIVCNDVVLGPTCAFNYDSCACEWTPPLPCSTLPPTSTGSTGCGVVSGTAGGTAGGNAQPGAVVVCNEIECAAGSSVSANSDTCCPTCSPPPQPCAPCSAAVTACPENYVPTLDSCGCTGCLPKPNCSAGVACPAIACVPLPTNANNQAPSAATPAYSCCGVCPPQPVNCSLVTCSTPVCNLTVQKLVVPDDGCCAECLPNTQLCATPGVDASGGGTAAGGSNSGTANLIATPLCDTSACGSGLSRTAVDGYCCPLCMPTNYCAGLACPLQACPAALTSLRNGSCCRTCSLCIANLEQSDAVNGEKRYRCDRQDNFGCHVAYQGADCATPKPVSVVMHNRLTLTITDPTTFPSNLDVELVVLEQTTVPRQCFNSSLTSDVAVGGKRSSGGTVTFDTYCDTSQQSDCSAQLSQIEQLLSATAGLVVSTPSPTSQSAASAAVASALLLVALPLLSVAF